tara:strand:- start:265 stop:633 length:369 start_codon:yes stop_codon:yes gene_type:complete
MGYRSKVIIGVKSGELSKEFDEILRKHEFPVDVANGDYLKTIDDPNEMKRYQFEQIKWYETDDWCKEIMDWLEKQDDNTIDRQDGLQNVFCVGMAYDDGVIHSEIGDYWDYVDVISEINLID